MSKTEKLVAELTKALRERPVVEAIGAILEEKLLPVIESIVEVRLENEKLVKELSVANTKIDELERSIKAENLIITGLPISSFAEAAATTVGQSKVENQKSTEDTVLNFLLNEMKIQASSQDISVAYRLRKQGNFSSQADPPPIFVRFTTRKLRDTVYGSRRMLKHSKFRAYVNEDLTRPASQLFLQARKHVKDKSLISTWTNGGMVYVRNSTAPGAKPLRITSMEELVSVSHSTPS